jgi:hypothetical protein
MALKLICGRIPGCREGPLIDQQLQKDIPINLEGNEAAYLGLHSVACLYRGQCAQGLQELDIGQLDLQVQ